MTPPSSDSASGSTPDVGVAVFAPLGRDARLVCDRLRRGGLRATACSDAAALGEALVAEAGRGAGVLVLAEEALGAAAPVVRAATAEQPAWSELPVVVLARQGRSLPEALTMAEALGPGVDTTALARPVAPDALFGVVRNAVSARRRQYEVRDLIDALRRSEQAHRESEERLWLALRAADAGAWVHDLTRDEQVWSPELFGLFGIAPTPGGVRPAGWPDTIPPEEQARLGHRVNALLARRSSEWELEYRLEHPVRGERWHSARGQVDYDGEGQARRIVGITVDITDRKLAEMALRRVNESLGERVEERTREVRALARALAMAEQEERRRIARVLHDDLQQVLFGAKLMAGSEAEHLNPILDEAITLTRTLSHELSPPFLQGEDLEDLLRWMAERKRERLGMEVEVEVHGDVAVPEPDLRVLLYQLLRELLLNVVKHAGVRRARLVAEQVGAGISVAVEDEGAGFDPAALEEAGAAGLGLPSVRERLELVGGTLEVSSAPGEGTRIRIAVPISQEAADE